MGNDLEYGTYIQRLDRPPPTYPPSISLICFVSGAMRDFPNFAQPNRRKKTLESFFVPLKQVDLLRIHGKMLNCRKSNPSYIYFLLSCAETH